jgi:hypothetical protein
MARGYGGRGAAVLVVLGTCAALLSGCGGGQGNDLTAAQKASRLALASSIAASNNANAAARSAPPKAPVDAAFRARANALCATVNTYNDAHPNPYPTFNYLAPDVPTMEKVGAYFAASPYESVLAKLAALPAPQQNPATWSAFLAIAQQVRGQTLAQIKAALTGDTATFIATLTPIQSYSLQLSDAAHQVGFAPPDACDTLFRVS